MSVKNTVIPWIRLLKKYVLVASIKYSDTAETQGENYAIGGDYIKYSFSLLRRGGTYVGYANPLSLSRMFRFLGQVVLFNLLPNGRSAKYYGTGASRFNRRPFLEDWTTLFKLLEEGKIKPVITKMFPILEAAQANEFLESGQVVGNIVLEAPELL